jgi:2-C-methyl-D-erythritol 2,4-cyclodiphosphate synthase
MGRGDLGQHFPSNDPRWKGVESLGLLRTVMTWVEESFEVINADLTLVASAPIVAPFLPEMRGKLASLMNVPEGRVNIKASNPEGIGSLGKGTGMAAHCVVLLKAKGSVRGVI